MPHLRRARMLEHINDLILRLDNWGYVIVFLIVMLECQAFLGFFMPGESMVMVAGFLAGQEVLDVRVLIAVVAAAAILGDSIGYEFGRRLGRDWLRRHGEKFWLRPEQLDRLDAFFRPLRRVECALCAFSACRARANAISRGSVASAISALPHLQRDRLHSLGGDFFPPRLPLRAKLAFDRALGGKSRRDRRHSHRDGRHHVLALAGYRKPRAGDSRMVAAILRAPCGGKFPASLCPANRLAGAATLPGWLSRHSPHGGNFPPPRGDRDL